MAESNVVPKQRAALTWRLSLSAVLIPLLVGLFVWDHALGASAPVLLVLCLLLALRAVWELAVLLRTRSFEPHVALASVCSAAVILAGWRTGMPGPCPGIDSATSGLGPAMLAFAVAVLAVLGHACVRYREPGANMETLGAEVFIVAYVGVLLSVTSQLRWVAGADAGYLALGSLLMAAKMGDVGAYTLGRLFGRRKMAPRLSPGKTWMGAIGALAGTSVGSVAWFQWAPRLFDPQWQPCQWYWAVLFGVLVGLAGLIGDLSESLIKRDVGKKDSASLLPGFGGVLDLLDSVLYAGPVAYVLWRVLPLATWN